MPIYTVWGPCRGGCRHAHKSLRTAAQCLLADREGCKRQGGYSDRSIRECASPDSLYHHDTTQGPGVMLEAEVMAEVEDKWNRGEWR